MNYLRSLKNYYSLARFFKRIVVITFFVFIFSVLIRQTTGVPNAQINFIDSLVKQSQISNERSINSESSVKSISLENYSITVTSTNFEKEDTLSYKKYVKYDFVLDVIFIFILSAFIFYRIRFVFQNLILHRVLVIHSNSPPHISRISTFNKYLSSSGFGVLIYGCKKYYGYRGFG